MDRSAGGLYSQVVANAVHVLESRDKVQRAEAAEELGKVADCSNWHFNRAILEYAVQNDLVELLVRSCASLALAPSGR